MAAPFKKKCKVLLEKDCEFAVGIRGGRVLELRPEGYLVFWEEWTDPETGECHESTGGVISYDAIVTENNYGNLTILRRPLAQPFDPKRIRRVERLPAEIARQRFKKQYVLAIQEMIDDGDLELIRDDFCDKIIDIVAKGKGRYDKYLAALAIREGKRGGAKTRKSKKEIEKSVEFHQGFKCGQTMWKWYWQWRIDGEDALFDKYRNCGKHRHHDDATDAFIVRALNTLWDKERPTVKAFVESVQSLLDAENERRERLPVPTAKMKWVGYDYILSLIKEHAPLDHKIRKKGWDKTYKDLHTLGVGIETSRALQRVEIDEYTVDLFVLMESTGLFDHLPESIKQILQLDGRARRVTLSAALDVHTRCFLALQIVPEGIDNPLSHTLEMIYTDKNPIADASGAKFRWPMSGAPETIVLDRGPAYITDDAYDILASLGITNLGAPAGKPWLKPFIERVFRTVHSDLLLRFSGRAFSNVVERGDNDPVARATLTLESFLMWLVRWTVDAYHTRKHASLGMSPKQAWDRAFKECEPRSLCSDEMREAFGIRGRRKVNSGGLRVCHIDYQADALMEKYLDSNATHFDFLRWDGDIGTISVRSDDGPWTTVPAADEMWIGKTDTDLRVWLQERAESDEEERIARRDFLNEANKESARLKQLMGLISLPKTPAELRKDVERFMRHADTAERRHKAGPHRELLADLDDVDESETEQLTREDTSEHDVLEHAHDAFYEDSME
ncbi:DDE-type integrase/transposase/recombinase [Sulfitobacter sp. 1A05707]|uniref:DDE-type integrase/transposase/recombinase n=1 Tax=Sulfitobacter sp. 1A05707 TaxID=3368560 RepID=UPI0014489CBF|nr:transposase [Rhodobacteraceae bacterium R_SAG2]|tara:strand:+ start:15 stop:2210 length:2196 start_codon:yes stop_codon:yes gene_type:complete